MQLNFIRKVKKLAVFDFDHTISALNTDLTVRDLIDSSLISPETKKLYRSDGWTQYMQNVFKHLYQNGKTKDDMCRAIRTIPEISGMKSCIKFLAQNEFDVIIISDSNSVFIDMWNEHNGITNCFYTVYTNKARFDDSGLLCITPYHHQTDCKFSSTNLCKGTIMKQFLEEQEKLFNKYYEKIFVVGDGSHDICPMLKLDINGYACARDGFPCSKDLVKMLDSSPNSVQAKVYLWKDGNDLLKFIKKELK